MATQIIISTYIHTYITPATGYQPVTIIPLFSNYNPKSYARSGFNVLINSNGFVYGTFRVVYLPFFGYVEVLILYLMILKYLGSDSQSQVWEKL